MKSIGKSCTAALALFAMAGQSWAGDACLRTQDATALKAAALQQELMVAALTCSDITLYNHFVITYRTELQRSDSVLQSYFLHANARTGMADYHAYKTRLANESSLNSIHDPDYCASAKTAFDNALEGDKTSLAQVVAAVSVSDGDDYATCDDSQTVAGGSSKVPFVRTAYHRN